MTGRAIDLVAAGPPSPDLYDPAASAWALASALAARGHSVQVAYPGPLEPSTVPVGVAVAPFPPVTAHLGTYLGDAELARSAGHRIRPTAEIVVRDPAGLGALGHHLGRHPTVVSFLRGFAEETPEDGATDRGESRLASKVLGWRERRGVRRLEKEALAQAVRVYCSTVAQRERLRSDYGIPEDRIQVGPTAVALGPPAPGRQAARRLVGVPDDVLLALVLPPVDPTPSRTVAPALEAFRRSRPIFPGVRLAVLGVPDAAGPGVVNLVSRDAATVVAALSAADVTVAYPSASGADPGLVLALRAGLPSVVGPTVDLGPGSESAVRRASTTDSGELASVLAELFADPDERRRLGERARAFASRFEPARLAEELEGLGRPSAR